MSAKTANGEASNARPEGIETSDSEDDDYYDEDEIAELPQKIQRMNRPRQSVSAEVYGVYNPKEAFVPRVVPKNENQKEMLRGLLLKIFMFQHLEKEDLNLVIDAMEERTFSNNEHVIKQGDDGDELYVNYKGTLDCSKVFGGDTKSTFLKKYVPGEVFGELCLLYNTPRAASIVATSDCVLYSLDRKTFNHIGRPGANDSQGLGHAEPDQI